MSNELSLAFIGGGNMASALASGLAGRVVPAERIHVIEVNEAAHAAWRERGMTVSAVADERLSACTAWIYAVKPQVMHEVVEQTRPYLRDSLVISIAAGVRSDSLANWLSQAGAPWRRLVRCMPNTPSLIGAGASGLAASADVNDADRALATRLLEAVGEVVWVDSDAALDAVTALSGSGPAYVFLFLQALIDGGVALGMSAAQSRALALATLAGATRLAAESSESPDVLRERVTSKGGTTAAALDVLTAAGMSDIVSQAMRAAAERAQQMGDEFAA